MSGAVRAVARAAVRAIAGVAAVVGAVIAAFGGAAGVAMLVPEPAVFLAAGWLVLAAGIGLVVVAMVGRRPRPAVAAVVVASVVAGALVLLPLPGPHEAADEVPGMRTIELPTGSTIAYVRVPASRGAATHVPQTAAEPVVGIHGGPGVADMAGDLAFFGRLAGTGREVILYDQVGAGASRVRRACPGSRARTRTRARRPGPGRAHRACP